MRGWRDPLGVLGLPADASPQDVTAAYRRLAKRWHPDRAQGPEADRRMAEINAAYELLRDGLVEQQEQRVGDAPSAPPRPRRAAGAWLADDVRRALGAELLQALEDREQVELVTAVATWASPQAVLALTDRRLLWLLDDAPTHRVRSLRFRDVARVDQRLSWPRRRRATVRVRTRAGARHAFAELRPSVAATIVRRVAASLT
jgi:hypothetical protein